MPLQTHSENKVFGGRLGVYSHASTTCQVPMRFSLFLPPQTGSKLVPVVFWLSGLTCTEDNFTVKAGAYRVAAELGLAIVAPDTSPRGEDVPDNEAYDLGQGAGFYVDATQGPWRRHYNMDSYVTRELPDLIRDSFPLDWHRQSIMGHSMGGHGALTIWLKNPGLFRSTSAFSPICAPSRCPWGQKAFTNYLGPNSSAWEDHDATALMRKGGSGTMRPPILIDQGTDDPFLAEQLMPEVFQEACTEVGQSLRLRFQEGYDHSYFFIGTFIEDHLRFHAAELATV
ncbi:S-formylglutathione hydrolase [Magnetospira sp. QH-2]|uniref:S-formylglutathione hydrolase n=1 Tax=Magnetospira sp. (strain QH-2) TaxID=1288970 RepID=UPI0003E81977|nr:S-formylglutathione hydrolase [Magnetospira sp. QH-2]CCQ72471.1 CE1 : S-formylglutathione hydrolase [Magnetospira sp. QH-2]